MAVQANWTIRPPRSGLGIVASGLSVGMAAANMIKAKEEQAKAQIQAEMLGRLQKDITDVTNTIAERRFREDQLQQEQLFRADQQGTRIAAELQIEKSRAVRQKEDAFFRKYGAYPDDFDMDLAQEISDGVSAGNQTDIDRALSAEFIKNPQARAAYILRGVEERANAEKAQQVKDQAALKKQQEADYQGQIVEIETYATSTTALNNHPGYTANLKQVLEARDKQATSGVFRPGKELDNALKIFDRQVLFPLWRNKPDDPTAMDKYVASTLLAADLGTFRQFTEPEEFEGVTLPPLMSKDARVPIEPKDQNSLIKEMVSAREAQRKAASAAADRELDRNVDMMSVMAKGGRSDFADTLKYENFLLKHDVQNQNKLFKLMGFIQDQNDNFMRAREAGRERAQDAWLNSPEGSRRTPPTTEFEQKYVEEEIKASRENIARLTGELKQNAPELFEEPRPSPGGPRTPSPTGLPRNAVPKTTKNISEDMRRKVDGMSSRDLYTQRAIFEKLEASGNITPENQEQLDAIRERLGY